MKDSSYGLGSPELEPRLGPPPSSGTWPRLAISGAVEAAGVKYLIGARRWPCAGIFRLHSLNSLLPSACFLSVLTLELQALLTGGENDLSGFK